MLHEVPQFEIFGIAAAGFLWAAATGILLWRAATQFGAYTVLNPRPLPDDAPSVDVVIPVRNEADMIAHCVRGIASQDYPSDRLNVFVVDDGSTDGSDNIARVVVSGHRRFHVIDAGSLPPGWTGKTHACWRGADRTHATWICFIDADTIPRDTLLRSAIAMAQHDNIDLLSLEPHQILVTSWERFIIPTGLCLLGFTGDLRRFADRHSGTAAANGQFILVRRSVYERVGGHAAVRSEIAEDSALAARVKAAGGRVALMDGRLLVGVRMYRGLSELRSGLTKNVTDTFGGIFRTALVGILGALLAWSSFAIPGVIALVLKSASLSPLGGAALAFAAAGSLAICSMHVAAARYFAIPLRYGFLFPIGYALAGLLAFEAVIVRRRGHVTWKGRRYEIASDGCGTLRDQAESQPEIHRWLLEQGRASER